MKVAIVGATGMVGKVMMKVLEERNFPITDLTLVASKKSAGKKLTFKNSEYTIVELQEAVLMKPNIALFSAGGDISLKWAEKFAKAGATVIDNSSAWRMDATKKLIIPEINANVLNTNDKIIANPNCSTIQMLIALAPLHKKFKIKRIVVSTYQSITGTGVKAVKQLEDEIKGIDGEKAYPYPINKNALPHCDDFEENGYTKEELKLVRETQKILDPKIAVTATAVRIPVVGGHSEAVNLEFEKDFELSEVRETLLQAKGVAVLDDIQNNLYPMPINSQGKDEVFVGRIRKDLSQPKSLNMFIVADNLRKGAATNTIQIAEYLLKKGLLKR